MFPLGHIAVAVVTSRVTAGEPRWLASTLGALLPDIVDKTNAWVLKIVGQSHHIAHTPLAAALTGAALSRTPARGQAGAVALAMVSHLVADEAHHGKVPWLMPLSNRRRVPTHRRRNVILAGLAIEVAAVPVLYWLRREQMLRRARTLQTDTFHRD